MRRSKSRNKTVIISDDMTSSCSKLMLSRNHALIFTVKQAWFVDQEITISNNPLRLYGELNIEGNGYMDMDNANALMYGQLWVYNGGVLDVESSDFDPYQGYTVEMGGFFSYRNSDNMTAYGDADIRGTMEFINSHVDHRGNLLGQGTGSIYMNGTEYAFNCAL